MFVSSGPEKVLRSEFGSLYWLCCLMFFWFPPPLQTKYLIGRYHDLTCRILLNLPYIISFSLCLKLNSVQKKETYFFWKLSSTRFLPKRFPVWISAGTVIVRYAVILDLPQAVQAKRLGRPPNEARTLSSTTFPLYYSLPFYHCFYINHKQLNTEPPNFRWWPTE